MNGSSETEITTYTLDRRFRSPGIIRKNLDSQAVTVHSIKNSNRSKSTEPLPLSPDDPFSKQYGISDDMAGDEQGASESPGSGRTYSLSAKSQESMSKPELLSSYRLLMNEKLRLERFLSIMTKNNEMARNRLESDLLDAMVCIEDLKQALEVRMARRRKIDPREAEERRYLIRQNKKLLNQLYESAKKIERLELTKVEMKEQLELLDFQILEVENQKNMMEEELRKLPSCNHVTVQTESDELSQATLVRKLQEDVNGLQSNLYAQKSETAAAMAKVKHLDNLVRDLRRDNMDLRDQITKLDDAENSLAESDKPLVVGTRELRSQLDAQLERVRELESKLEASRDYSYQLEKRLEEMDDPNLSEKQPSVVDDVSPTEVEGDLMYNSMESANLGLRTPRVDDLLLHETIRTFHALIAERDQELIQLKRCLRSNQTEVDPTILPDLSESCIQTDLDMFGAGQLSSLADVLSDGGLLLKANEVQKLWNELEGLQQTSGVQPVQNQLIVSGENVSYSELLNAVQHVRQQLNDNLAINAAKSGDLTYSQVSMTGSVKNISESQKNNPSQRPASAPAVNGQLIPSPAFTESKTEHFKTQLEMLRETGEFEVIRSQLNVSEHRRTELEQRVADLTEELARARTDARTTETSLSATRRTEAALRRRLLVAMDMRGGENDSQSNRNSLSFAIGSSFDTRDTFELQAALAKAEATIISLNEAAQLDRNRLNDQALRIGQLEAEHRALLDRISLLQATEATAQRGIVRLQTLYEDMLREYSEARSQDMRWRERERSRSNYRNKRSNQDSGVESATTNNVTTPRSDPTISKLREKLNRLESENRRLKESPAQSTKPDVAVSTTIIRRCSEPACIEVRRLLRAFQNRYSDVIEQLDKTQHCLETFQSNGKLNSVRNALDPNVDCLVWVGNLENQLSNLRSLLNQNVSVDSLINLTTGCSEVLTHIRDWLKIYLQRTDTEMVQLRHSVLELRTNKSLPGAKNDVDVLSNREEEIVHLRSQLRDMETQLDLLKPR